MAPLAAGVLVLPASGAQAVDHRPCVSKVEFQSVSKAETKTDLEERWEVAGLGRQQDVPVYGRVTIYPRCGYSIDQAWYAAAYAEFYGQLWVVGTVDWKRDVGLQPHGHP